MKNEINAVLENMTATTMGPGIRLNTLKYGV